MAKTKVIDSTTQWKGFVSVIKELSVAYSGFVRGDQNELYLKIRSEGEFIESMVVLSDPAYTPFYQWMCSDIDTFLSQMKFHNIKIKGTTIIDSEKEVRVLKDMETKFSVVKLTAIQNMTIGQQISNMYRVLPQFLNKLLSPDTNWIPLEEEYIQNLIDKKTLDIPFSFKDSKEYVGSVDMILSPTIFPLLKKASSLEFAMLKADREKMKYYIGIKESHAAYDLYSIIAIMMAEDM